MSGIFLYVVLGIAESVEYSTPVELDMSMGKNKWCCSNLNTSEEVGLCEVSNKWMDWGLKSCWGY